MSQISLEILNLKKLAKSLLREKAKREAIVYRLSLLGWTQEEIGRLIGRGQSTVSEILSEILNVKNAIKSLLARGDSVEDVAGKLGDGGEPS